MDNSIHNIHTPCKKCVFAKYEDNTQVGCHLDYIEKYKASNIEIIEAYDDEKEFYIINDKKCIGYREDKWFNQFNPENDHIETKIKIYNGFNRLHYLLVINLKEYNISQLNALFADIAKAKIQPQKIILVRYRDASLSFNYNKIENLIKQHNISYAWRVQTMLDDEISYGEILHNITAINQKYRFIISVSKPTTDLYKLIDYTDKVVHQDLDQFVVISNSDKTSISYSGAVYRFGLIQEKKNILIDYDKYTII